MLTLLQVSVAVATPVALVVVTAGHCRVRSAGQVMLGAVVSITTICWLHEALLPQLSVAVRSEERRVGIECRLVVTSLYQMITLLQVSVDGAMPVAVVVGTA